MWLDIFHSLPCYNQLENYESAMQVQDDLSSGRVKDRHVSPDDSIVITWNDNIMLNAFTNDVECTDEKAREDTANEIAKNLMTRAKSDWHTTMMLKSNLDRKKDITAYEVDVNCIYDGIQHRMHKTKKVGDSNHCR